MSTSPTIKFIYDFGSPNAHLVHLVIPALEQRLETEVRYSPVLLGGVFNSTGNVSPAISLQGIKNKGEYMNLETNRFIRKHGLENDYTFNPNFPVNTLLLMRTVTAAQIQHPELYKQVINCFFDAMWREPKKMDDPEIVAAALNAAGLPADELLEAAVQPDNKKALIEATDNAVQRGVFGAPSFFVGDELFFGKDRLREVEEEFLAQRAS